MEKQLPDKPMERLLEATLKAHLKCEQISYDHACLKRSSSAGLYRQLGGSSQLLICFLPFLFGPGITFGWFGWNPCLNKSSALFGTLMGLYGFIVLLGLVRAALYIQNVKFCFAKHAIDHVKYHVATAMMEGAFLNFYLLYTWCHNQLALGGSGICAIFYLALYFTTFLESHSRFCWDSEHSSINSTYNNCGNALAWIDGLVVVSVVTFYIMAYWLDSDLDFPGRSTTECKPY
jgi:hypothetical protein